ncbi:DUF637 domain-containing protein, partial [Pseudomonas sp. WS 5406]
KAGENLTLSSAANEQHDYSKGKKGGTKTTTQLDDVTQQSAELKAGGDLIAIAGTDLTLVASKISAGNEAYVHADNELQMLAAQDSHYSLYDMSKKGSWGSKKTQRDEVTDVKSVGSEVKTGGDLTLESGGDQKYQAAKLDSGGDIAIVSGGAVTFEAVKDLHQESHEKSKSDLAWNSAKGKGNTDETLRQTEMVAQGQLAIRAAGKINIDIRQVDQQTVSQTIDAMVKAEPKLAWIKQAEANGQVDWRVVKEIHDSWDYKNSGLGAAPALIISIVASFYLGPLAGAMASNFAVGTINGGGDIGAGFKAATNKNAIKGYATQMVTSGILAGIDTAVAGWSPDGPLILNANGVNNPGYSSSMLDWNTVSENVLRSSTHALVAGSVNTAINGGSLKDNLGTAAISEGLDLTAAFGNKQVGDLADYLDVSPGTASKIFMHAVLGGALSSARGGDFKTGALAGAATEGLTSVAAENLGKYLDTQLSTNGQFKVATAQVIGVLAGALGNGDPETASWVAGNAQRYNDFLHMGGNWGAAASSLGAEMIEQGKTPDQISEAFRSLARSDGYEGPGHDYVAGWVLVPGAIGLGVASAELAMGCALAPVMCNQAALAVAEVAGGDAALGGTALGVFGGGALTVAGGAVQDGGAKVVQLLPELSISAKKTASFSEAKTVLESAQLPYKGSTVIGHALSKHAGRNPDIWGKTTGSMATWNEQAMTQLREIIRAPGEFKSVTTDKGIPFIEKRLGDGRGIRLNLDGTFKGFID